MATIYKSTSQVDITALLDEVERGKMALPEFQRSFVWKPEQVKELLNSVAMNYPIGSILRVERGIDLGAIRGFEDGPTVTDLAGVETTVLDG